MGELAIVTSDIHIHSYKAYNEGGRRLKHGIAYLDYIFRLADVNGIKYILLPGDLFNNMIIIATSVVREVTKCLKSNFDKFPNILIIAVSGNHDQNTQSLFDSPGESALEYLTVIFPNFILLDKAPHTYFTKNNNTIVGINYYEHSEHFRKVLEEVGKNRMPGKIHLLTHQTIGSGLPIEDTIDPTDPLFDPFDFIYNAHIHSCEQVTDRFINIGSPMHRDAGDIGKKKGFWIVDLDDPVETISFVDITTKFPQFIYKTVGEELEEWEKDQYIIWQPDNVTDNVTDKESTSKYRTDLSPQVIMQNYCDEVLTEKEREEKLTYGLTLLT